MSIPYATATSDMRARQEARKILILFGCEGVGIWDEIAKQEVILEFRHRVGHVRLPMSAKGWAANWLKENPYNGRRRMSRHDYEQRALRQGYIAANSALRDWVKSQITIIESGMVSVEAVFMPFMITSDGRTVIERIAETKLLSAPAELKVVQLPPKKQDGDH